MAKNMNDEQIVATTQEGAIPAAEAVPVKPAETQYNRYNMALPRSFSIYNEEGSVIYRGEVESVVSQLKREVFEKPYEKEEKPAVEEEQKTETKKGKKAKETKAYDKKRSVFLIVPMVLFAVILAAAVLGAFDTKALAYVAGSKHVWAGETYFGLLDPALGFLKNTFEQLNFLAPATWFFNTFDMSEASAFKAEGYVLIATTLIYMVFAIEGLIITICGLAGKKKENGYRKAKLGFLSIVMFVCAIGMILCVGLLSGVAITDFLTCFSGEGFTFGYASYALLAIPVLTFVCSCVAYRRVK